jgi:hypothetical protein
VITGSGIKDAFQKLANSLSQNLDQYIENNWRNSNPLGKADEIEYNWDQHESVKGKKNSRCCPM